MRQQPYRNNPSNAVSPVIGVMLMLVVTIIIAAVVSAFSGGLVSGSQKTPTATFDVRIKNTGEGATSSFYMKCTGVSEPIPTKNVKIITSWKAANGESGGATILPVVPSAYWNGTNTHYHSITGTQPHFHAPRGTGPGIDWGTTTSGEVKPGQDWGNYTLVAGVTSQHWPQNWANSNLSQASEFCRMSCGYGYPVRWQYNEGGCYDLNEQCWSGYLPFTDSLQALLGMNWYNLKQGDVVHIKFIYIPTGKLIAEKDVMVEGG